MYHKWHLVIVLIRWKTFHRKFYKLKVWPFRVTVAYLTIKLYFYAEKSGWGESIDKRKERSALLFGTGKIKLSPKFKRTIISSRSNHNFKKIFGENIMINNWNNFYLFSEIIFGQIYVEGKQWKIKCSQNS